MRRSAARTAKPLPAKAANAARPTNPDAPVSKSRVTAYTRTGPNDAITRTAPAKFIGTLCSRIGGRAAILSPNAGDPVQWSSGIFPYSISRRTVRMFVYRSYRS